MKDDKNPKNTGNKIEKPVERDEKGRIVVGSSPLNPNGRPLGSPNFKTQWEKAIKKIAANNEIDVDDVEVQLFLTAYKKAQKGDYRYYQDIIDRVYGKPQAKVDVTTLGGSVVGNAITFTNYGTED